MHSRNRSIARKQLIIERNNNNNNNEVLYAISPFSSWKKRPNGHNKLYYEQNQQSQASACFDDITTSLRF
jgi:hypothetical protein